MCRGTLGTCELDEALYEWIGVAQLASGVFPTVTQMIFVALADHVAF
jgi:hypothetical protein